MKFTSALRKQDRNTMLALYSGPFVLEGQNGTYKMVAFLVRAVPLAVSPPSFG
jgi:hypothetical protein